MKLDRDQFELHAGWALLAGVLMILGIGWHTVASWSYGAWLGGGSAPGLVCGVLAGLIILFEMLLWPRKTYRRLRLGATKHWMAAHIWLGLACLPLAIFHCGMHLGGMLPTLLMILLVLAILSGIFGLVVQNILPGWMLRRLPAETIYSQIDYVSQQAVDDSRRMLVSAFGAEAQDVASQDGNQAEEDLAALPTAIVIGAVREVGWARGRTLRTTAITANREDAPILWDAFRELEPFLLRGAAEKTPFSDIMRSKKYFDLLRRSCHAESVEVIDTLEQQCDQRRQFDTQQRVHLWLHAWIPLHMAVSVAVSILLIAHIVTALWFW